MIRVYSPDSNVFGYAFLNINPAWTIESYWTNEEDVQIYEAFFGTTIRFYYRLKGAIKSIHLDFSFGGTNQLSLSRDILSIQIQKNVNEEEYQYLEIEIDDRWVFPIPMRMYSEMNLSVAYSLSGYLNKENLNSIDVIQFRYENGIITGGPNYRDLPAGFSRLSRRNIEQKVHALVLHRTAGSTLTSALNSMVPAQAAHLYVDTDGGIYQGVSLQCNASHVGRIRPRNENRTPATKEKHYAEIAKDYPERYPFNEDSLGIEVVGTMIEEPIWTALTEAQILSTARLTNFIITQFGLVSAIDIYAHEVISSKKEGEGLTVLNAIRQYII